MIAAEGEHKASRALRHAAEVIAESPSALQVTMMIFVLYFDVDADEEPDYLGGIVDDGELDFVTFAKSLFRVFLKRAFSRKE